MSRLLARAVAALCLVEHCSSCQIAAVQQGTSYDDTSCHHVDTNMSEPGADDYSALLRIRVAGGTTHDGRNELPISPALESSASSYGGVFEEGTWISGTSTDKWTAAAEKVWSRETKVDGNLLGAYVGSIFVLCLIVCLIYYPFGATSIINILVFLLSMSAKNLVIKRMFTHYEFKFSMFMVTVHLLLAAAAGFAVLARRSSKSDSSIVKPSYHDFVSYFLPLSIAKVINCGAGVCAMKYINVAFAEVMMATDPVCTVVLVTMLGLPFKVQLLAPVVVVVMGAALEIHGEMHYSMLGLLLSLASNFGRSFKMAKQQQLMTGVAKRRFDPFEVLAWQSLMSFFISFVWTCITEGTSLHKYLKSDVHGAHAFVSFELPAMVALWCLIAVTESVCHLFVCSSWRPCQHHYMALHSPSKCLLFLTLCSCGHVLTVVKDLGAVGNSLVLQLKLLLAVLGALVFFHESLQLIQIVGIVLVIAGAFLFARLESSPDSLDLDKSKQRSCSK
eukprot:gnl/TRDRNA2_/TRDRNA2_167356_c0_seq5.p1 gnl/TRDRNA2_/TRDRNA2_167356_c0~~gnl/TRDRNA2_/TRDRNA2_167356_c0_seq5.p1  ORF type:complete len:503 (+),score=58.76 gnl/TRDRNA2_/TRDRNA2_167356_c0_seq5:72-1580(+)